MVEAIKGNAPDDTTEGSPTDPNTERGVPLAPRARGPGDVPRNPRDNDGISNGPKTDDTEPRAAGKGNQTDQPKLDIFGEFRQVEITCKIWSDFVSKKPS